MSHDSDKRKVLCVCIGGTVRSVGIKDVLNGTYNCDALAASAIWQSDETLRMLCEWADLIVPVVPRDWPHHACPERDNKRWMESVMWDSKYDGKRKVLNVGEDVWCNARHPELRALILSKIGELL